MKFITIRRFTGRISVWVSPCFFAAALAMAGCGAEGEGSIKAPTGGVEAHLGRPFGEPTAPPPRARKSRSAPSKAIPPDHTNPRS